MNDDLNSEWGLIYIPDLLHVGAVKDDSWVPLAFPEAKKLVYGFRRKEGTKEHYDWWRYENKGRLEREYKLQDQIVDLTKYAERTYKIEFGLP